MNDYFWIKSILTKYFNKIRYIFLLYSQKGSKINGKVNQDLFHNYSNKLNANNILFTKIGCNRLWYKFVFQLF